MHRQTYEILSICHILKLCEIKALKQNSNYLDNSVKKICSRCKERILSWYNFYLTNLITIEELHIYFVFTAKRLVGGCIIS